MIECMRCNCSKWFAVKQLNLSLAQSYVFLDSKSELFLMVKSVLRFLKTTVVVVT